MRKHTWDETLFLWSLALAMVVITAKIASPYLRAYYTQSANHQHVAYADRGTH